MKQMTGRGNAAYTKGLTAVLGIFAATAVAILPGVSFASDNSALDTVSSDQETNLGALTSETTVIRKEYNRYTIECKKNNSHSSSPQWRLNVTVRGTASVPDRRVAPDTSLYNGSNFSYITVTKRFAPDVGPHQPFAIVVQPIKSVACTLSGVGPRLPQP